MRPHFIVVAGTVLLSSLAPAQAQRSGQDNAAWDTFVESSLGTQVEYPADLFVISEGPMGPEPITASMVSLHPLKLIE